MITVIMRKLGREKAWGQANFEDNTIELDPRLQHKKHLEILLHEALHILNPTWSETKVLKQSKKLATILWKEKYRRPG